MPFEENQTQQESRHSSEYTEQDSMSATGQQNQQLELDVENVHYVGFGMRMLASVIDTLLSALLIVPLFDVVRDVMGVIDPKQLKGLPLEQIQMALIEVLKFNLMQLAVMGTVVVLFWVYRAATPGKMLLKMKIVDAKTFGSISWKQSIGRFFAYIPAVIPLGLGFVWVYYDKRKQGWHDKLAGTVVIYSKG